MPKNTSLQKKHLTPEQKRELSQKLDQALSQQRTMFVKVSNAKESFWLILSGKDKNGYIGIVDNKLEYTNDIKYKDLIYFRPKNIYSKAYL